MVSRKSGVVRTHCSGNRKPHKYAVKLNGLRPSSPVRELHSTGNGKNQPIPEFNPYILDARSTRVGNRRATGSAVVVVRGFNAVTAMTLRTFQITIVRNAIEEQERDPDETVVCECVCVGINGGCMLCVSLLGSFPLHRSAMC
ncbi:hypothetical protein CBL_08162 [Carabus blaptoides fortunei]